MSVRTMFEWLQSRRDDRRKAGEIYGAVVAQAREPAFFLDFGVADTPVGRYEMIALHLSLALDRLGARDVADAELARALVERFVTDMDDAMREMGVSDISVPRNVKKAAAGLYERWRAYLDAIAASASEPRGGDGPLAEVVARYVYPSGSAAGVPREALALSAYVRRAAAHLAGLEGAQLRDGKLSFPPVC